jgi:hypothetical protein
MSGCWYLAGVAAWLARVRAIMLGICWDLNGLAGGGVVWGGGAERSAILLRLLLHGGHLEQGSGSARGYGLLGMVDACAGRGKAAVGMCSFRCLGFPSLQGDLDL